MVVSPGDRCDADLTISVIHENLAEEYVAEGETVRCFEGRLTRVDVALTAQGRPGYRDESSNGPGFPRFTTTCPDRPLVSVSGVEWHLPVTSSFVDLWGPAVAVWAYRSENGALRGSAFPTLEAAPPETLLAMVPEFAADLAEDWFRGPAATLLGLVGPEAMEAVPDLVDALADIHDRFRVGFVLTSQNDEAERIVAALCLITGEDPYWPPVKYPDYWQQWWEEYVNA